MGRSLWPVLAGVTPPANDAVDALADRPDLARTLSAYVARPSLIGMRNPAQQPVLSPLLTRLPALQYQELIGEPSMAMQPAEDGAGIR